MILLFSLLKDFVFMIVKQAKITIKKFDTI